MNFYDRTKRMDDNYTVIDFETTGFQPRFSEIIQIGAVKYKNNQEIARFNELIQPTRSRISPKITKITGITPAHVVNSAILEQVLPDFLSFIGDDLLVAHNAPFDMSFLLHSLNELNVSGFKRFRVFDTLESAREKMTDLPNHKLETIKEFLSLDLRSHDALNDCLVTGALYQYLKGEGK